MEKKLFIASAAFLIIAIIFGALYFMNRTPEQKENVDFASGSVNDTDNDGLTNEEEDEAGTDPEKFDSDNDRISDYAEIRSYKTNPLSQDTDRDGYSDKTEIDKGFNPLGK